MVRVTVAEMQGNKKPDEGGSAKISALESQLQQAWLQSQIPKVQRRTMTTGASVFDVSVEKRACSQSPAELPLNAVSGGASDAEKTYFHKSRQETVPSAEFLRRFATPQLETISEKTDMPVPRSISAPLVDSRISPPTSSNNSGLTQFSSSDEFSIDSQYCMGGGVFDSVDSEGHGSGFADLAGQTEPLALFLDDILTNEELEEEKYLVQETDAYQAMEREISDLLAPVDGEDEYDTFCTNFDFHPTEESSEYKVMAKEIADLLSPATAICDDGGSVGVDKSNFSAKFAPSEEDLALMMMDRYTSMLSKHIKDVSACSNVDYRTWITEKDEIQIDESFRSYFEAPHLEPSATTSGFDFNLLLRGAGQSNLSPERALSSGTSMTELLYRCALAVSQRNTGIATDLLAELQSQSSPHGSSIQRMAHYFVEALVAKMSGTGEELYTVITSKYPSAATMMKAFRVYVDYCPYIKLGHFFTMKMALDAFEGAPRIHVIQYGIQYGVQWPTFLQHLSLRPEGPPHVRMTGVDYPYPGVDPCKKINETGNRLAEFAKKWGVPFEFQAFAGKWESFKARDFDLRDDEVLVVQACNMRKNHDECVLSGSPRELSLKRIRSLNPKVFIFDDTSAAFNAPLFMTRFREAVKYYKLIFDGMELSMPCDDPHRVILEREIYGREILNIVACEGQARVERAEPYRQWHNRLQRAGFTLRPANPIVFDKAKAMMATFHKNYGIGKDEGWFLMGIDNQILRAISVWEPTPLPGFIS